MAESFQMYAPSVLLKVAAGIGLVLTGLFGSNLKAENFINTSELGGHFKYQGELGHSRKSGVLSRIGEQDFLKSSLDVRLKYKQTWKPLTIGFQPEFLGQYGDNVNLNDSRSFLLGGPAQSNDRRRLFDLTADLENSERALSVLRIDRLFLSYGRENYIIEAGRQALTWGNGLVFQVIDLFNPFSPISTDRDYKSGDDLVHGQYLFPDGGQLEILVVPRRDENIHTVDYQNSSGALRYKRRIGTMDGDITIAEHFDEPVVGFGVSQGILDGVARADLSYTDSQAGGRWSYLVNYDRSFVALNKNVYFLLEFFHNGFGQEDDYSSLNEQFNVRLIRGELFSVARDYLAAGAQIELTAKYNLFISQIFNLNDSSSISQIKSVWDMAPNTYLTWGIDVPTGSLGTEFGGIQTGQLPYPLSPPTEIYLRIGYYF